MSSIHTIESEGSFGSFPVRTELTVIPADPVKGLTIGFRVYEGVEVLPIINNHIDYNPFTERDALHVGDQVAVASFVGGYHVMTVETADDGGLRVRSDKLIGLIAFGEDDRKCWVCKGFINMRGIEKLSLTKDNSNV